jgi:dihydroflavonol-4-reductase
MTARLSLVTGGNGFVGSHVVRALLARGDRVRALVRKGASLKALEGLVCEIVTGDLCDTAAVAKAVNGCTQVYHVAADYRLWVPDPAPMYAANVDGTRNVLEAARRAGVERVVHTSTVGTLGLGEDGIGREDVPVSIDEMTGAYKRSKFMAEQIALEAARNGLPVVIVNPSTPVGALDYKPTPTGRIIVDFLKGRMTAYLDTGLNLVDVEDVGRGHLLAAEKGRVGERYILGGLNLTLKELFARLAALSGVPAPKFEVPYGAAYAFALVAEGWARAVTKKPPRASLTEVRMASRRMFFDSSKAREELGYAPGPVDSALTSAIAFYRRCGMA